MGIPGLLCEGAHQRCGPLCAPRYAGAPREHGFAMLGAPEVYAGLAAPATPDAGAPREHGFAMLGTRVTFPSRGKSPKARQGLRPLESPEGDRLKSETLFSPAPPAASRNPLDRAFSHNKRPICHFEFVGKSVLFFSSGFIEGTLSVFNLWLGRIAPEDA